MLLVQAQGGVSKLPAQLVLHGFVLGAPLTGGGLKLALQLVSLSLVFFLVLSSDLFVFSVEARFHVDMIG